MAPEKNDLNILIVAPFGIDAEKAAEVLMHYKINSEIYPTVSEMCARLERPAGALLIAEEAFNDKGLAQLRERLSSQESWSDIPIILLLTHSQKLSNVAPIIEGIGERGNVSLLERPFGVLTLITMARVALKARSKQFEIRDLIRLKDEAIKWKEEAINKRDEFLNIVSHELKTPITALKLQIQIRKRALLKGDTWILEPDKIQSLLEATDNQVERIYRLVDEMLDIARLDNNKLILDKKEVELGTIVSGVVSLLSVQYSASNVPLQVDFKTEPKGKWDRSRIEQVLINFLTNALKYGGGTPVKVTVDTQDYWGIVTVTDEGPGISEENQKKIFDRYERGGASSSVSGLGLGLYISKQIVDMHGGKIFVESSPGKGAKFILRLPLDKS